MFDEAILRERAPPVAPSAAADARSHSEVVGAAPRTSALQEYLTFRVGHEEYAIDILCVQEIRSHSTMTRIAHAPDCVKGVVNLRGVVVPVVDLRSCLQVDTCSKDEETVTIVLDLRERVVGVMVDAVSDVLSLTANDISPAPRLGRGVTADSIVGIACVGQSADSRRMLVLLDIERLLRDADVGL